MAKLVAFDTNICVWGIRKMNDRDNLISRCQHLIKTLKEQGYSIIIPAPVLGELLAAAPIVEQATIHDEITKILRIYPFDVIAAEIYAQMVYKFHNGGNPEDLKAWAKAGAIPRQKLKIDYMIAAIAKAVDADFLYTEDDGLRKFASPFLQVQGVPRKLLVEATKAPSQQYLFGMETFFNEPSVPRQQ